MKKLLLLFFILMLAADVAFGQCAMCTAVADEATKNGSSAGAGINKGVLYLFLSPYLIVGTLGFIWWRNKRMLLRKKQFNAFVKQQFPSHFSLFCFGLKLLFWHYEQFHFIREKRK